MTTAEETEAIEVRLLLQAIHERYGYDFRGYALESVTRRLRTALTRSGLKHLGEVQHRLLASPEFFESLLQDLTVQVTEMFRDPAFYKAFRGEVVPLLRTYPQVKIWHAGCATGEEVYATAITLAEEQLLERAQFYATDINAAGLERASQGIYAESVLPSLEQNYVAAGGKARASDYYTRAYGGIAFREGLRKKCVFFQHDLVSEHALGEMQVIFCRNVMIYFGASLRERVIDMFAHALGRGGFLCLGASERGNLRSDCFTPLSGTHNIYRRTSA